MAKISSRVEIAYQEEKPVLIPKEHIMESMDKQWLKLRPTSQPIVQLLAGNKVAKNSSLSGCQALHAIIAARNQEYDLQTKKVKQQRHCLMSQPRRPERDALPKNQRRSPSKRKAKPSIAS